MRKRPSSIIGYIILALGLTGLVISLYYESNTLAFIGTSLIFWGTLLTYTRTKNFIRSELLDTMIRTYYTSIQRFLDEFKYRGEPIYIPPTRLRSFRAGIVFIGSNDQEVMSESIPSDTFTPLPNGICIIPPGLDLTNLLEVEIKRDFSRVDLEFIQMNLPKAIIEGLELAKGIELVINGEEITMKLKDSLYESFYRQDFDHRIMKLGCPLVSSIAMAFTRSTGKRVTIEDIELESMNHTINVVYKMLSY